MLVMTNRTTAMPDLIAPSEPRHPQNGGKARKAFSPKRLIPGGMSRSVGETQSGKTVPRRVTV